MKNLDLKNLDSLKNQTIGQQENSAEPIYAPIFKEPIRALLHETYLPEIPGWSETWINCVETCVPIEFACNLVDMARYNAYQIEQNLPELVQAGEGEDLDTPGVDYIIKEYCYPPYNNPI